MVSKSLSEAILTAGVQSKIAETGADFLGRPKKDRVFLGPLTRKVRTLTHMKSSVTLGLVQMTCGENPEANLLKAKQRIKEAASLGAQIVCLSELFSSVYFCQTENPKYFALAEPVPGPTTQTLCELAKELKIVIIGSVYEVMQDKKYFNTAVVCDADGTFLGKYRKMHIPNDLKNHYGEAYYFAPGDLGTPVFQTRYASIGVLICWDQWYPEVARKLALDGAQIIFYPTAIGFPAADSRALGETEWEAWQTIQRSHAIANNVFVAACNRVGKENFLDFWGTSFVAGPLGQVLQKASRHKEEIVIAVCDLASIEPIRADWPFLKCRRGGGTLNSCE